MNKMSQVIGSVLVSLGVALTAAVALSAPAQAMTVAENTNTNPSNQVVSVSLSNNEIEAVKFSVYAAKTLCADTSDAVIPTSSSWFDWNAPTPNGQIGAQRCMWDLFFCVKAGGRSVTFKNYAGPMGWTYWGDYCS